MKNRSVLRLAAFACASAALLAGCGGGGGGSAPVTPPSSQFGASANFENMCTLENEKKFVRSYLDEVYLWYDEIPTLDASKYTNIPDYFNALLVTTPDPNGLAKDRFSAVLPSAQAQNLLARVGSSRVDLQACKLEYSIVSPK